jgi:hypothetical protein
MKSFSALHRANIDRHVFFKPGVPRSHREFTADFAIDFSRERKFATSLETCQAQHFTNLDQALTIASASFSTGKTRPESKPLRSLETR